MNEQEVLDLQIEMAAIFRRIDVLPLDKLIRQLDHALTFTPMFDPTLWVKKVKDGELLLNIAKAFQTCRDTIRKEFKEEPK